MEKIITGWKLIGAFALLLAGLCACASSKVQNKESLLSSAGFRSHTPSTQTQLVMFKRMTPYKLERNTVSGKALYSYADPQRGVVYIGGDKAYQRYRQLALQQSIEEKRLRRPIAITSKLSIRNSARTTTEKIGGMATARSRFELRRNKAEKVTHSSDAPVTPWTRWRLLQTITGSFALVDGLPRVEQLRAAPLTEKASPHRQTPPQTAPPPEALLLTNEAAPTWPGCRKRYSRFQGLWVAPKSRDSDEVERPNSGVWVLPKMTRPARFRRTTISES
jgi:hypothetical protein